VWSRMRRPGGSDAEAERDRGGACGSRQRDRAVAGRAPLRLTELRNAAAGGGREENVGIIWGWGEREVASEAGIESKAGGPRQSAGFDGSCGPCNGCGMATRMSQRRLRAMRAVPCAGWRRLLEEVESLWSVRGDGSRTEDCGLRQKKYKGFYIIV
jgi:hypothetical protein